MSRLSRCHTVIVGALSLDHLSVSLHLIARQHNRLSLRLALGVLVVAIVAVVLCL